MRNLGKLLGLVCMLSMLSFSCDDSSSSSDTDTDTDTGEPDWGDPIPCENEPREGEVCIPGGKYVMGCVPGDDECEENEKPLVEVTLSPFFMSKYEAQLSEVLEFLNSRDWPEPEYLKWPCGVWYYYTSSTPHTIWLGAYTDPENDSISTCPIEWSDEAEEWKFIPGYTGVCPQGGIDAVAGGFGWLGAKMFCEWKGMQLPTEAQWEAAARGQTLQKYPCDIPGECWYSKYACRDSGMACYGPECRCGWPFSPEIIKGCESPYGLEGMYGNGYEWVADAKNSGHSWCETGCSDPAPVSASYFYEDRIVKGGSVTSDPDKTRISARSFIHMDTGNSATTVRCVRPDEPLPAQPDAGM